VQRNLAWPIRQFTNLVFNLPLQSFRRRRRHLFERVKDDIALEVTPLPFGPFVINCDLNRGFYAPLRQAVQLELGTIGDLLFVATCQKE
jgi:hypothetical protein